MRHENLTPETSAAVTGVSAVTLWRSSAAIPKGASIKTLIARSAKREAPIASARQVAHSSSYAEDQLRKVA